MGWSKEIEDRLRRNDNTLTGRRYEGDELEMQEVYRLAKCRVASRVKLEILGKMDMGVLRGEERCGGREVATAGVKLACRVVRI